MPASSRIRAASARRFAFSLGVGALTGTTSSASVNRSTNRHTTPCSSSALLQLWAIAARVDFVELEGFALLYGKALDWFATSTAARNSKYER
jgi:hypothetical protein